MWIKHLIVLLLIGLSVEKGMVFMGFKSSIFLLVFFFGALVGCAGALPGLTNNKSSSSSDGLIGTGALAASWAQHASFSEPRRFGLLLSDTDELIYVTGDTEPTSSRNDVVRTRDGSSWELGNASVNLSARQGAAGVYFNGYYWIVGGYDFDSNDLNDVWRSADGITWEEVTSSADFSVRSFSGMTVFDGKMWLFGGLGLDDISFSDVWTSTDGVNWTEVPRVGDGWEARSYFNVVVFDDKLWISGGYDNDLNDSFRDVWYSSDGASWTEVIPQGELWDQRSEHCFVASSHHMFIVAGILDDTGEILGDIWYSTDGVTWTEHVASGEKWVARHQQSCALFENKLWVAGGRDSDSDTLSDVWSLDI